MSPFWILLELRVMEVVSGDNWSCKVQSASQIVTINKPTSSCFTGRMSFLSPNQQHIAHLCYQEDDHTQKSLKSRRAGLAPTLL